MSVQALVWVFEQCPDLPKHLVATMLGLANHADENGRGAHPSQDLLAWYTRKGERSCRRDLEQLEELGLISRGDQRKALWLSPDKRPVVWDLAMHRRREPRPEPKTAGRPKRAVKPQVSNGAKNGGTSTSTGKKGRGRPPKNRADVGVPPIKNPGDVHVRGDVDVRADADVPRTSLGVTEVLSVQDSASSASCFTATHDANVNQNQQQGPESRPDLENHETGQTAEYVRDDPRHYPTLTAGEQALLAEVVSAAPLWSERMVRRVLGSDRIREIGGRDPELVRRAFLLGAQDSTPGRETHTVPMRMWHVDKCPHWAAALRQLTAERSGAGVPAPVEALPVVDRPARLAPPPVNEPPVTPLPAGEDPRALARANAARPPSVPPARRSRVPKPAQPSEDAAARAATEEARARSVAALAQAFPGEVPAPA